MDNNSLFKTYLESQTLNNAEDDEITKFFVVAKGFGDAEDKIINLYNGDVKILKIIMISHSVIT